MRGFKLAIAKKTLSKNEYAAYEKAMKDGKITVDELYPLQEGGKSRKLNEDLWKALNHLPANAIGDEEAEACVEALGSMVGANDVVSLKRVLEYSFVPTGQSIKKAFPAGTGVAMVELPVYAFRKSALLERMGTVSDSTAASFGPGSQVWRDAKNDELPGLRSRWADMMAASQLLHLAAGNVKPQGWDDDPDAVWGSSSDRLHLEVGIALPSDNADSTARLVTLEAERYWQNDPRMANQSAYNDWAHQVSAGISGTPGDVYRMLAQRSGKSPNFNWLDSTGKQLAQAAIDKVIGILPGPVSEVLSTAYGIGAGILDDLDGAKAAARQTTLGNAAGRAADNPLLNVLGFALTFNGSDGDYEGNFMHPDNRLIMTETTRGNINATVRDYNALHSGSGITADEVISDLAGNPIDTIKEAKENVKYNSVTNQKDYDPKNEGTNSDFLRWCKQDADLQYAGTVTDIDGTTHQPGERVEDENISNYEFASGHAKKGYQNYERIPGTGTH